MVTDAARVDFWFDPVCPWSWVTSRWIEQVRAQTSIEVRWHPLSLAILRPADGNKELAEYNAIRVAPSRVMMAVYLEEPHKLGELYSQLGPLLHCDCGNIEHSRFVSEAERRQIFVHDVPQIRASVAKALAIAGLDARYADAFDDEGMDEPLKSVLERIPSGRYPQHLQGVPTLSVNDGGAFHGPVLCEVPSAADSKALFDAFATLVQCPDYFGMSRSSERPAPIGHGCP